MAEEKAKKTKKVKAEEIVAPSVMKTPGTCEGECACKSEDKVNVVEKDWFAIAIAAAFGLLLGVLIGLGGDNDSARHHHFAHMGYMGGYQGYDQDYANNYGIQEGFITQGSQYDQYGMHGIEQGLRSGYLTVEGGQVVPMFLTDSMEPVNPDLTQSLTGPTGATGVDEMMRGPIMGSTDSYKPTYGGLQSFDGSTATTK